MVVSAHCVGQNVNPGIEHEQKGSELMTPGLWIGSGGTLGWICHIVAAITAHHRARVKNRARGLGQ